MRDIDTIETAMRDAIAVLGDYNEPGPRDAEATLKRMMDVLDREDVKAARERLAKGYGLRVVK